MIEEHARVVAVQGDTALLQTQRQSSCGSCEVKSGCGTSVLAGIVGQKMTQLKVQNTLNARPGDEVVLGFGEVHQPKVAVHTTKNDILRRDAEHQHRFPPSGRRATVVETVTV